MPKVIKKRSVKKKTVQEENVKSVALQAVESLKKKQQLVVIVVSVIVAVFVLLFVFSMYSSSQYKKAYSIEMDANQYYYGDGDESLSQEDRWKKAMELYQQSVDVKATPTALFYLGNCYFNLGDYENAIKQYNIFADKFSVDKGILPLVYQKLASSYFKVGQNDKALDTLSRLGKVNNGIFKDTALVFEARYFESAGESVKALDTYRKLIAEFPSSTWIAEANAKISASEAEAAATEKKGSDAAPAETKTKEQPAAEQQSEKPSEK